MNKSVLSMLVVTLLLCMQAVAAQPNPSYWQYWDKSNERNYQTINHQEWDQILQTYVVTSPDAGVRQFRYGDVSEADHDRLDHYVRALSQLDPRQYRKQEQQAYWMNLYNVLTVQLVLDDLGDVLSHPATLAISDKSKDEKRIKVAGEKLSLNDIEHRILRPLWRDHRIHFGLNRASMDSPNMDPHAYTAATIKDQLKAAGVEFVNDDRGIKFSNGTLMVSRLFRDYDQDFAKDQKTLLKLFAYYAKDNKALYLLGHQGPIQFITNTALNSP